MSNSIGRNIGFIALALVFGLAGSQKISAQSKSTVDEATKELAQYLQQGRWYLTAVRSYLPEQYFKQDIGVDELTVVNAEDLPFSTKVPEPILSADQKSVVRINGADFVYPKILDFGKYEDAAQSIPNTVPAHEVSVNNGQISARYEIVPAQESNDIVQVELVLPVVKTSNGGTAAYSYMFDHESIEFNNPSVREALQKQLNEAAAAAGTTPEKVEYTGPELWISHYYDSVITNDKGELETVRLVEEYAYSLNKPEYLLPEGPVQAPKAVEQGSSDDR